MESGFGLVGNQQYLEIPQADPPIGEVAGQLRHFANGIWIESGDGADVQLAVTLLLDVGDHSLESGAASDGGERLGGDAVRDALKALLHERFTLWPEENKAAGGGTKRFTHSHP